MIEHIQLENFTAFSNTRLELSPKINILIGENATGKTHLLKAIYSLYTALSERDKNSSFEQGPFPQTLTSHFIDIFLPLDRKLGKLHRHGATAQSVVSARFASGLEIEAVFHKNSKTLELADVALESLGQSQAVFIPAKEILSLMKGFISLYETYDLSLDQTYQNLALLLDLPEVRQDVLQKKAKWAVEELEAICGGRFLFHGGGRITFLSHGVEYSVNSVAEGFLKYGTLARLLKTGAIRPGVSGPVLWDEPEANLNPKMIRLVVEILYELARQGQQVIIATHDFVTLKWFELLGDKEKGDQVFFHSFSQESDSKRINVATTDNFIDVSSTDIDEAFGSIIDYEVGKTMGSLGK